MKILVRLRDFWLARDCVTRWRIVFGFAAAAVLVWLLDASKPWEVAAKVGNSWDPRDFGRYYGWIAGAINFVLLGGLALVCPWWARPTEHASAGAARLPTPRWFWPLVLLAMVTLTVFSLPRMNDSFWDDEELNIRTTLFGRFKADNETGEVAFRKFTWAETLYGYKKGPNTHTFFTVLSRVCADAWNAVSPPAGFPVVEWPFRVPALAFGVVAVGTLAWMLLEVGLPGTGVVAAFLLALHPWHIRYASEARGYSVLICLVPFLIACSRRALVGGRWRWWAAFGATSFAMLYAYPGSLFVVVLVNLVCIGRFVFGRDTVEPRLAVAGRWFLANVLAAMVAIQLMLPLVPQGQAYFERVAAQGFVAGEQWLRNTSGFLLGGAPWTKSGTPFAGYPEWLTRHLENPALFAVAFWAALAFILLGAIRLVRQSWPSATLVAVAFLCPPVTFTLALVKKFLLYEPYIIYALPGLVACAAAGITALAALVAKVPSGKILGPATAVGLVALWVGYTQPVRGWLFAHTLQPIRESVMACRGTLDPRDDHGILTASFSIEPYLYDAHMRRLASANEMVALMHEADRLNRPLVLNVGMPWAAREYSPNMWALMHDPALFEPPLRLTGFEPSLDRLVVKYKPHAADGYAFPVYANDAR